MLSRLHPVAGVIGFLTILTFWLTTVAVEALGTLQAVLAVTTGILWGMVLLVPALVTAGATGARLAGPNVRGRALAKLHRMRFIAGNGALVPVPCAFSLQRLAAPRSFGTAFHAVQATELCAGAVDPAMMGLNIRDGLQMTRRRRGATAVVGAGS